MRNQRIKQERLDRAFDLPRRGVGGARREGAAREHTGSGFAVKGEAVRFSTAAPPNFRNLFPFPG